MGHIRTVTVEIPVTLFSSDETYVPISAQSRQVLISADRIMALDQSVRPNQVTAVFSLFSAPPLRPSCICNRTD